MNQRMQDLREKIYRVIFESDPRAVCDGLCPCCGRKLETDKKEEVAA